MPCGVVENEYLYRPAMTDVAKTLEELCTERGMRMTEQRRVIARILKTRKTIPTSKNSTAAR